MNGRGAEVEVRLAKSTVDSSRSGGTVSIPALEKANQPATVTDVHDEQDELALG